MNRTQILIVKKKGERGMMGKSDRGFMWCVSTIQGPPVINLQPSLDQDSIKPWRRASKQSDQIRSVAQLCPTVCYPMNRSTPGLPVHHQLPEFTQTHVHRISDAIQPSHPLSSPSPPAPRPSQHQSLFQWVNSSHQVAKGLELEL